MNGSTSCSRCGTENEAGRKFCMECGGPLALVCPSCSSPNVANAKFCGECGTLLGGSQPAVAAPVPVEARTAERRMVSVMFADLVGFTTFSEGRDPEEVRDLLTRYFESAREIVELYGGTVEKFIGDAVMAVWGTPVAREDDAERAVRTALDLVLEVAALGKEVGVDLRARSGVFTGEVAVTIGATGQGMVAGDSVNTAARLQSVADPGAVLVDELTYQAARDAISFEDGGAVPIKGKEKPVSTWRPIRVVGGRRGFRPGDSLEPPFTGRDEELRLIKDLLNATGREVKPRLASVIGVGGIGKSRLVWELFKYVDGISSDLYWHQGRSPAYGEGVAFWALAEMVRMRARIAETDDPEEAAAKLAATLEEYLADEEERRWIAPRLEHLLGLQTVTDDQQEQLFSAWRTFFERIAERGTVILVFEDLHWADPGLVDFVEHMMAWARSSPIFIVTLARPELMDRRPNWGAGQRNFVSVHLEPLSNDDLRLLLKGVISDLPTPILEEVVERSEGIPLYAVEMVRMLIDRDQLVPVDGEGYTWSGTVEHIDVPDSLHSLIASRLDSLSLEDRLLVQDASVLGKTFTIASLAVVSELDPADLDVRLRALSQREIFSIDSDPRSPERGQYGFVQSLIKEVAYLTLAKADRCERHVRAAQHFESLDEADMVDVVATHYVEAFRNSVDEARAAALASKARQNLVEAAERAGSLGSRGQAFALYESALDVTTDARERARLMRLSGDAAGDSGQFDLSVARLEEAAAVAQQSGDADLLAQVRASLGGAYFNADRLDDAEQMLEAAVKEISDPLKDPRAARLFAELGRICAFKGDWEKGRQICERALPPAEANGLTDVMLEAVITQAVVALALGQNRVSEVLLMGAMDYAAKNDMPKQYVRATINLSANLAVVDMRAALEACEKGLAVSRRLGITWGELTLAGNALETASHLAKWDLAREFAESLQESGANSEANFTILPPLIIYLSWVGDLEAAHRLTSSLDFGFDSSTVQVAAGTVEAALIFAFVANDNSVLAQHASHIDRLGEGWISPTTGVSLARSAYHAGDIELAKKGRGWIGSSVIDSPWLQASLGTVDAAVAVLEGDRARGVELYEHTIGRWTDVDLPLDKALCQFDFALLVGSPEADTARSEAITFFENAGNSHLVERLKA